MRAIRFAMWILVLACVAMVAQAAVIVSGPTVEFTNRTQPVIRWTTDVATGSRVFFGETLGELTRRAEGDQGTSHSVLLPVLKPGSKWFFTAGTARVRLATNSFVVPTQQGRTEVAPTTAAAPVRASSPEPVRKAPPTRETWGYMPSLADHFERHGGDFRAKNADDYARMAWEFQQRAKTEGLPTKVDSDGVKRIYDPKSGAFGAYNRDGTTKTFFKPNSRDYFERQPGKMLNPKRKN